MHNVCARTTARSHADAPAVPHVRGQLRARDIRRCGKSSIQKVVFHKMSPHETLFLEATSKIVKTGARALALDRGARRAQRASRALAGLTRARRWVCACADICNSAFLRFEVWDFPPPSLTDFTDQAAKWTPIFAGCSTLVWIVDAQVCECTRPASACRRGVDGAARQGAPADATRDKRGRALLVSRRSRRAAAAQSVRNTARARWHNRASRYAKASPRCTRRAPRAARRSPRGARAQRVEAEAGVRARARGGRCAPPWAGAHAQCRVCICVGGHVSPSAHAFALPRALAAPSTG